MGENLVATHPGGMIQPVRQPKTSGFTVTEILTAIVAVIVLVAVAIPTWRTHQLRARRADAIEMLLGLQRAQDVHFGRQARYAAAAQLTAPRPEGLQLATTSKRGFYRLDLQVSEDGLGYLATARAQPGGVEDPRCVALGLDQNGRRRAVDAAGEDRTADCWR
jgi:type IV pilus assembly protein PilE